MEILGTRCYSDLYIRNSIDLEEFPSRGSLKKHIGTLELVLWHGDVPSLV